MRTPPGMRNARILGVGLLAAQNPKAFIYLVVPPAGYILKLRKIIQIDDHR